jgi:hypothetical protein
MTLTKKYNTRDIMRSVMDDMAIGFNFFNPVSFTYGGTLVDTEFYDIVPKPALYENLINEKQSLIEALDRQHESEETYYRTRRAKLLEEKEKLLRDRDKRNKSGG